MYWSPSNDHRTPADIGHRRTVWRFSAQTRIKSISQGEGASSGPDYPFLWGHPVVPIYGDISKNSNIAAYGKGANIAFLVLAHTTAKSYMM